MTIKKEPQAEDLYGLAELDEKALLEALCNGAIFFCRRHELARHGGEPCGGTRIALVAEIAYSLDVNANREAFGEMFYALLDDFEAQDAVRPRVAPGTG